MGFMERLRLCVRLGWWSGRKIFLDIGRGEGVEKFCRRAFLNKCQVLQLVSMVRGKNGFILNES